MKYNITLFHYRFTSSLFVSALVFFLFYTLIQLGFWQLSRATEKKSILQAQPQTNDFNEWQESLKLPPNYHRIRLKGQYLPDNFLLDNQHRNHQIGFNVITPLQLDSGAILLIDRGFIPSGGKRHLEEPPTELKKSVYLTGQVYYPSNKQWIVGPEIEQRSEHLSIIERVNINYFTLHYQKRLYPFVLRLDSTEPDGYFRDWPLVSMPPSRHQAYAFQWFALAFMLGFLFIFCNIKRVKP